MKSQKLIEVVTLLSENDFNFSVEFITGTTALVDMYEDESSFVVENEKLYSRNFITREKIELSIEDLKTKLNK